MLSLASMVPERAGAQVPLSDQPEAAAEASDPFERETPRSAAAALISALAQQDYVLAGNYFATDDDDPARAAKLAQALQASLDAGGTLVPFAELSNDPTGRLQDELPPDLERIGTLGGPEEVPILLTRQPLDEAANAESEDIPQQAVWRVSEATIGALEARSDELANVGQSDAFLVAGAPLADWALLLGLVVAAFASLWIISSLILRALRTMIEKPEGNSFYQFLLAALPPFSLLLATIAFRAYGNEAPVAIVARQIMLRYIGIVAWVALAWFAIRLVDAIARKLTAKLDARERRQAASAVTLARRAIKALFFVVAAIAILDTLGINITTGIAALGIGGLALALGAQKTIENLVGSVTVVADRPVQVGDYCKIGDVLGTVEDIGMRSTRIRTNSRTLVTIPNGDFASRQIENYSSRDSYLFDPIIGLEYGISAAQLRKGIAIVEQVLIRHPLVAEDPRRARLSNFGASSLEIDVFAYIQVTDFAESLAVREELLLSIFEQLEEAGFTIALPAQTVYLRAGGVAGCEGDDDRT